MGLLPRSTRGQDDEPTPADRFIARWANAQLFLTKLPDLLGVPPLLPVRRGRRPPESLRDSPAACAKF